MALEKVRRGPEKATTGHWRKKVFYSAPGKYMEV